MNYNDMTKEELIQLLEDNENSTGKYGLVWDKEKEPEIIVSECDKKIPILKEEKKLNINSKDSIDNLLIEGDNFHSLSVLNYTHKEAIDVIYIDPPYNTGNEDFMYNDKFVNYDDGYKHSKWLNFMEKRLKLARTLLKDTGVIFISIDDNEQAQLKLLCNKIFGEENFIDTIMVEMSITSGMKVGAAKDGAITKNGEFVHVYAKSSEWKNCRRLPLYDYVPGFDTHFSAYMKEDGTLCNLAEILSNNMEIVSEFQKYGVSQSKIGMKSLSDVYDKSNIIHDFIIDNIDRIAQPRTETPILPDDIKLKNGYWTEYISEKRDEPYYLSCDENGKVIRLIPMSGHCKLSDDFIPTFGRVVIRGDYWKGFWRDMVNVYKEGDMQFKNGKKPIRLMKQLFKWAVGANKNAIILDFFAGSGSTGHAVLDLNKEDDGNRKFILCTNNENNICREVTYTRLKNVIEGYGTKEGLGSNLKYYKCDFIDNSNNRDQLYFDLTEKCIPMLCIKDNNYIEYKITDEYKIYTNSDKSSYSCVYYSLFGYKEDEFIKELKNIDEYKSVYKFSLGDSTDLSIFKDVTNYTIEAIPYRIVELYKKIVKMSRED